MNSINKDAHVSRRWILSIGRQKARSYIAQKYADGTLFGEESLYTHINCMEMERVRKVDCCFDEFKLCRILMRSKKRLPDMIYTRIGPAIIKVSNIMDDIIFTPISLRKYANNKERMNDPEQLDKFMGMFFSNSLIASTVIFMLAVGATFPMFLFPHRAFSLTRH